MASLRNSLLKATLPLVRSHGFTRDALALSVLSLPKPHSELLSETAVSSLFGEGDEARRTLINAWLDDAREQMKTSHSPNIKTALSNRLRCNEPVLQLLPEAFAVLATPDGHLFDPRPALTHSAKIADEACIITSDSTVGPSWYARRASLAAIYTAAELHQLTSPNTAYDFLSNLLDASSKLETSLNEAQIFAQFIGSSWAGIIRSRGLI